MAEGALALVEVAHLSDTGRVRHHNEDRSLATASLLAVADGMGGAKAGEVAAQVAVDSVAGLGEAAGADEVRAAIEEANRAIRRMARDDADKSGMGTTMTAAMLRDGRLDVVHVGDSRAYLWRGSTLSQITEDHSVVAELVRRGTISAEEAEHHPHRNVITRALGAEAEVTADVMSADLREGDVVLVCSDGLSSYVSEAAIAEVLAGAATLGEAARGLVARANGAGGADNVTVVLGRVGVGPPATAGDTVEVPVVPRAEGAETGGVRVLGGVHGHAGAERSGSAPAPPPKVLEPAGRRRSKLVPVLTGVLVLLAAVVGGVAWVGSRTYTVEAGPQDTVIVAHGLPVSVFGQDLSSDWQDTGVPAGPVRASQPDALSSTARGQGEAVERAANLVWRFGLSDPPVLEAPETPQTAPTPPTAEATPGTTTAP
jgi:protein phosphatase